MSWVTVRDREWSGVCAAQKAAYNDATKVEQR